MANERKKRRGRFMKELGGELHSRATTIGPDVLNPLNWASKAAGEAGRASREILALVCPAIFGRRRRGWAQEH